MQLHSKSANNLIKTIEQDQITEGLGGGGLEHIDKKPGQG